MNYGTKKHEYLIERAFKLEDIGGFALTELAHGSNVKDIQTVAIYDHSKKEFVINTPCESAMKFWAGNVY